MLHTGFHSNTTIDQLNNDIFYATTNPKPEACISFKNIARIPLSVFRVFYAFSLLVCMKLLLGYLWDNFQFEHDKYNWPTLAVYWYLYAWIMR